MPTDPTVERKSKPPNYPVIVTHLIEGHSEFGSHLSPKPIWQSNIYFYADQP